MRRTSAAAPCSHQLNSIESLLSTCATYIKRKCGRPSSHQRSSPSCLAQLDPEDREESTVAGGGHEVHAGRSPEGRKTWETGNGEMSRAKSHREDYRASYSLTEHHSASRSLTDHRRAPQSLKEHTFSITERHRVSQIIIQHHRASQIIVEHPRAII